MTKLHNDLLRDIGTLARTIHYLHDLHFKELALQRGPAALAAFPNRKSSPALRSNHH